MLLLFSILCDKIQDKFMEIYDYIIKLYYIILLLSTVYLYGI